MTSYADLGPAIPAVQADTEPVTIHAWGISTDLNDRNEAVVSMTITSYDARAHRPAVLLLTVNPRKNRITHAMLLSAGCDTQIVQPIDVPGCCADLARTLTRERFRQL